jgi:hypothetical protein
MFQSSLKLCYLGKHTFKEKHFFADNLQTILVYGFLFYPRIVKTLTNFNLEQPLGLSAFNI